MGCNADWPDPWTAAAMRNAERLVQIEMADIGAVIAGTRETDLRIEIGAVSYNFV